MYNNIRLLDVGMFDADILPVVIFASSLQFDEIE